MTPKYFGKPPKASDPDHSNYWMERGLYERWQVALKLGLRKKENLRATVLADENLQNFIVANIHEEGLMNALLDAVQLWSDHIEKK